MNLESRGFLHIKDGFSRRSVATLYDHFRKLDLQESIKFKYVSYDQNSGLLKNPKKSLKVGSDSESSFENLKDHLSSYNFNVNSVERTVIQLFNLRCNSDIAVSNQKLPDGTLLAKLYSIESMNFVKDFFSKNKQLVENVVFLNKKLHPYLSIYPVHKYTKLFFNMPNCADQEVHCDLPIETNHRNTIYIIIPLNDCDEHMGTTVFYDNRCAGKYFTKDESWFNKGHIESLDDNMKHDLKSAEYDVPFQMGDAIVFFGDSIHRGTRNQSKKTRCFIHMAFSKNLTAACS